MNPRIQSSISLIENERLTRNCKSLLFLCTFLIVFIWQCLILNNKQLHIKKHGINRQKETVEPVQITAMSGKRTAGVFHGQSPLHQRFRQVAPSAENNDRQRQAYPVVKCNFRPEAGKNKCGDYRKNQAAGKAFP